MAPSRTRLVVPIDAQDKDLMRAALVMLRQRTDLNPDDLDDGALLAEMARYVLATADVAEAPTGERYRTVLQLCPDCRDVTGLDAEVDETHVGHAACDGQVVDLRPGPKHGHLSNTVPPARRRAVLHRDRCRCRVPGCTNRYWVDIHHIRYRHLGGGDELGNLVTLCGAHHRAVHDGNLAIQRNGRGELEFVFLDGRELRIPWPSAAPDPTRPRETHVGVATGPWSRILPAQTESTGTRTSQ